MVTVLDNADVEPLYIIAESSVGLSTWKIFSLLLATLLVSSLVLVWSPLYVPAINACKPSIMLKGLFFSKSGIRLSLWLLHDRMTSLFGT